MPKGFRKDGTRLGFQSGHSFSKGNVPWNKGKKGVQPSHDAWNKGLKGSSAPNSGKRHYNWKGGRIVDKQGYIYIHYPDHPKAYKDGYILEHRVIIEKHIGRFLDEREIIHHKNGVKHDNRIENLEIVTRKTHYGHIRCPHCLTNFLIK